MLVADAMTSPAETPPPEATVQRALVVLDEHAITMAPVTTPSGVLLGACDVDVAASLMGDATLRNLLTRSCEGPR